MSVEWNRWVMLLEFQLKIEIKIFINKEKYYSLTKIKAF